MDLATFRELLSPSGRAALAAATALAPTEPAFLACFERLRKRYPSALAKMALELAILRVKARAKYAAADRMYFTREALEQATGDAAAGHRARRFAPFGVVADLCCGIGGDALALAAAGPVVHAVETDPLRLAMTAVNAATLGFADCIVCHEADALTIPLPDVQAAFADPNRRAGNRRHLDPAEYTPSLPAVRARFAPGFPLAVKIAPGVARDDVAGLDAEVEFVSVSGELKECVLWFGLLRSTTYRATVLRNPSPQDPSAPTPFPQGERGEWTLFADRPPPLPPIVSPGEYVFDPDASVVRAGLAGLLAEQFGLAPIDYTVAMLTGRAPIATPFATAYRVEIADRFHIGRLRDHLRARGVGRVTLIKRGSMVDADEAAKKMKLAGSNHCVVLLTRVAGEQAMIVCERVTASSA